MLRSDLGLVLIAAGITLAFGCRSVPPWVDQGALIVHLAGAPGPATASVLYLEPESEPRWSPSRRVLVEVASDGISFQPAFTTVYVGDDLRFVNRGTVTHRIFITEDEGRRERLLEPGSRSAELRVSRVGENRFYCSLHPEESFVVFASPSLHFAVLNGERTLRIRHIPAGSYRLSWWSESGVRSLELIEIRSGEVASHSVSLESVATSNR